MREYLLEHSKGHLEEMKAILERSRGISVLVSGEDLSYQRELASFLPEFVEGFPPKLSDVMVIDPEGENIGIDEVRDAKEFLNYSPELYMRKYVIVHDCERMTQQAANAFLKTLEEPPEYAVIILDTRHWFYLLPTIRSRVFRYRVEVPRSFLELLRERLKNNWSDFAFAFRDFKVAVEILEKGEEKVRAKMNELRTWDLDKLLKKGVDRSLEGYLCRKEILRRVSEMGEKEFLDFVDHAVEVLQNREAFVFVQELTRLVMLEDFQESDFQSLKDLSFLDSVLRVRVANLNEKLTLLNVLILHRDRKRGVKSWS